MSKPNIKVTRIWTANGVERACKYNNLYTCSDNRDFEHMLSEVDHNTIPTYYDLYKAACVIHKYNESKSVPEIMGILEKDAVWTIFDVKEESDSE